MRNHYAREHPEAGGAIQLGYRALAAKMQVSHEHIANIFREADSDALFQVQHGRLVEISPRLIDEYERWAAWQIAHYWRIASRLVRPGEYPD